MVAAPSVEPLSLRKFARDYFDVVIVGGGPAGLASSIVAAERGFQTLLLERHELPHDKACGEGLLPPGVDALERLGVMRWLDRSQFHPFTGIRFVQEDGTSAESPLPHNGIGIRRTVLVDAMTRRAEEAGVCIADRCAVSGIERCGGESIVDTASGAVTARLVIAADGLHSRIRRASGLEASTGARRRFAVRRHYRVRPWTSMVEVHVDRCAEAYVTPVSANSVGVACSWHDGAVESPSFDSLLARFPALKSRLGDAPAISQVKGAGPMARAAVRRSADGLVLIGDAAGFVDSISGDGLSIAFNSALVLGAHLTEILAQGSSRVSLAGYEKQARRLFRRYWMVTNGLLWLARHPRARIVTIHYLASHRRVFSTVMNTAMAMMAPAR